MEYNETKKVKKYGNLFLKVASNILLLYFIWFAWTVYQDSKVNPHLYNIELEDSLDPLLPIQNDYDTLVAENKQLKGVYTNIVELYRTNVYPMFLIVMFLFAGKLFIDNYDVLKRAKKDMDDEAEVKE